jgi:hypothetical protein
MTQPKPPGPREFWFRDTGQEQFTYDYYPEHLNLPTEAFIHVIEMSAFQKLESELREAKAEVERLKEFEFMYKELCK